MTLDELRALDPKDMPNWPLQAQGLALAVLLLMLLGLGYFFVLGDQLDQLQQAKQQEEQLKQTFIDKKRQAVNLDALEQQLKEIDASFGALLKQLPTKSDMDTLLTEINQAGIGRGLQFDLFKPGTEIRSTEMAEVPITIRLTGTYNDLAAFVNDVAQLSRIVTISDINLTPGNGNRLTMDATARTYRALEPGERMGVPAAQAAK
ncbi:type 4a pilus biogenesis protein PilO [Chromobacterium amazonense]|uniref:Pilus assembly protein PilO n=1 Tax=Chromobacterium amazonense TaxID=1382803 RepID=A0A1S1X8F5_9NEIS|nr:type 4a pilus biogenesis protein PilO [Chromobacterium amazonense]KIA79069.1 pilus assembly protein PilO [Chromobacterium piscinae]MBM2885333.1 type 4a pilus biogenesis protein PilO [Chromobacterium amazonense]MDE1714293.1 type 4a pilus biogenesis protein PilO [Chromobacterium amazonense]MDQ4540754.1 type 4a pilus biogenesis protein PilO [Chromobacterium amazonense]OHX15848.1 pilus assembly protein PilO [Chromobacterium amazonense]